jgi:tRNA modification GTPase
MALPLDGCLINPPSFDIAAPNAAGQRQLHAPIITRARHRVQLEAAARFLQAFLDLRKPFLIGICASNSLAEASAMCSPAPEDVVLAAEELRYAAQAVGRVTGDIGVEDVLDSIFRDFCIGK